MLIEQYLIIPDLHYPYHDPAYINIITKIIKLLRPKGGIVFLGDFLDWWQLSNFDKDPRRQNRAYDDLMLFRKQLDKWDRFLPKGAVIHMIEGNHCDRLRRYNWKNNAANYEMINTVPQMLDLYNKEHHCYWHPLNKWNSLKLGDVLINHGFYFSKHVAMTCLDKYRSKYIFGHTHRFQYVSNGEYWSCSLGYGALESIMHVPTPSDWQQAFGILTIVDGVGSLDPVLVNDGSCVFRGKVINGRTNPRAV
jgi:UDP-2,3-diacylglucosamine pyrophosphatase LpxH